MTTYIKAQWWDDILMKSQCCDAPVMALDGQGSLQLACVTCRAIIYEIPFDELVRWKKP